MPGNIGIVAGPFGELGIERNPNSEFIIEARNPEGVRTREGEIVIMGSLQGDFFTCRLNTGMHSCGFVVIEDERTVSRDTGRFQVFRNCQV